jgi:3-hydroxyisobutyrate dehydrogenase-like beta-hydroxyacid dehydrogenase
VGGERSAFDAVEPALRAMGTEVTYLGASGNGQLTKMVLCVARSGSAAVWL